MSSPAASSPSLRRTPARTLLRISVGAWNREDELDRFVERVAELAANTPATLPRRPTLTIIHGPPSDGPPRMNEGPVTPDPLRTAGREVRPRSELEIRWRQARNAPPPVVRAVLANVAVAVVGGIVLLLLDWLVGRGVLPGDLAPLAPVFYVAIVIVSGSVLT